MKTWTTSGGIKITRILFGRSNVYYFSHHDTGIVVDTGWAGDRSRLLNRLMQRVKPAAVIMTHTHFDHAGNAAAIREAFDPVFIVHEREKKFLESGDSPLPKGTRPWTRFIYRLGAERVPQWFHVGGVAARLSFSDSYDLTEFGFNASVIHTPGHSPGSCSVVIDHEIALVGDLMTGMPWSIFPPWGDDAREIRRSWKKLLETPCTVFHPAHGFPVSRKRLEHSI
jgi:glyoxylase-like metal-dependent hydrolase (beta-lactamase superfamily II)